MNGLDDLLNQGEPERRKPVANNGLDSLYITEYAFEKAYSYARLAVKKARRTIECGGYLIAPKDAKDRIVTDSFLAKNQDVSDGLFTIEAEDVIRAGREIDERGYRVLGWWHSHGNLETFFSSTDDNGQRTVLNEICAFNYVTQNEEKEVGDLEIRVENGKIVMFDRRSPERKYEFEVNGDPSKISIAKLRLKQEKRIGFAYGLVVNNRKIERRPYAEIATRDLCGFCKNSLDRSVPTDVSIFDSGKFEINENKLMAEIEDRVKMRKVFFGSLEWKKYKTYRQKPLSSQQSMFESGFGYVPYGKGDEVQGTGFKAPILDYQKPIISTSVNPQPIKEDIPSDKKDELEKDKNDNLTGGENDCK